MAHFNFVISQNAKWRHAGFYIDCHRMTVPENILLQKTLQNTIIMWPRNASYGQDVKGQGQGRTLTKMEFLVSEFCNQLCCGLSLFLTLFVAELDPTKKNVTWIVFSASCRSQA